MFYCLSILFPSDTAGCASNPEAFETLSGTAELNDSRRKKFIQMLQDWKHNLQYRKETKLIDNKTFSPAYLAQHSDQ
jgi:hypothetical protein